MHVPPAAGAASAGARDAIAIVEFGLTLIGRRPVPSLVSGLAPPWPCSGISIGTGRKPFLSPSAGE